MTFPTRKYHPRDAAYLAAIFYNSVRQVGCRHYNASQVEAWAPLLGDPGGWNSRALDGRITLVAVDDDDKPIAYGDLEADGHIDHLYSSLGFTLRGVMIHNYSMEKSLLS